MIDEFLADLDRQTDLYRRMLATSESAPLRELLAEIRTIDRRIAPVRRRWPEVAGALDAETAGRARRSIEAARDVLTKLFDRYVPPPPEGRVRDAYGA